MPERRRNQGQRGGANGRPGEGRRRRDGGGAGGNQPGPGLHPPIPSPYNFVSACGNVLPPGWASETTQDVPFSDGISGWFDIVLEAKTPIYVRGPGVHEKDPDWRRNTVEHHKFYRLPNGRYAIPSTSIKGMIRNVVEIATGGSLASRIDDSPLSIRDLNYAPYRTELTGGNPTLGYTANVKAGWLRRDGNGDWFIEPCQKFGRIEHDQLRRIKENIDLGGRQPARKKYENWGGTGLPMLWVRIGNEQLRICESHRRTRLRYRPVTDASLTKREGLEKGVLVFTGQPGPQKHLEFVFSPPPAETAAPEWNASQKQEFLNMLEAFEAIHSRDNAESDEHWMWGWWQEQYRERKVRAIPVFYLGDHRAPTSMGLAMMYRLPYKLRPRDAVKQTSTNAPDFADTLFGFSDGQGKGLKGRVHFEPLEICKQLETGLETVHTTLGSPKPSFYPNYIKQHPKDGKWDRDGRVKCSEPDPQGRTKPEFNTLMDEGAKLRGWKRYWVRRDGTSPSPPEQVSDETAIHFEPLPVGSEFRGRIHLHNARSEEAGALLWALTWGGKENLRHSLGTGKPLGFGSVQIRLLDREERGWNLVSASGPSGPNALNATDLIKRFTNLMNERFPNWEEQLYMKELYAMANPEHGVPDNLLAYPTLCLDPATNHFRDAKKLGVALLPILDLLRRLKPQGNPTSPAAPIVPHKPEPASRSTQPPPALPQPEKHRGRITGKTGSGKWKVQVVGGTELESGWIEGEVPDSLQIGQELDVESIDRRTPRQWRFRLPRS